MILYGNKNGKLLLLFFLLSVLTSFAQEKKIKGKVTDTNGIPVPGASIIVKNTSIGTNTDFDGLFELQINDSPNTVLVVSYIGMKAQEVVVGNQTEINVALSENV